MSSIKSKAIAMCVCAHGANAIKIKDIWHDVPVEGEGPSYGGATLRMPDYMNYERQTDNVSCARHTLNSMLNILLPEVSKTWDKVAFPTNEALGNVVGRQSTSGWGRIEIAHALFEKSEGKLGFMQITEKQLPRNDPEDGRVFYRAIDGHATFVYYHPASKAEGATMAGWKHINSQGGIKHFTSWDACRLMLRYDVAQTLQVVSNDSSYKNRLGQKVPTRDEVLGKHAPKQYSRFVPYIVPDVYVDWLKTSGAADDQYYLGEYYRFGGYQRGLVESQFEENWSKAFSLYTCAMKQGFYRASKKCNELYQENRSKRIHYLESVGYYKDLANSKEHRPYLLDIETNLDELLIHFEQSAAEGDKTAKLHLLDLDKAIYALWDLAKEANDEDGFFSSTPGKYLNFQVARRYERQGQLEKALALYRTLATQGVTEARKAVDYYEHFGE